MAPSAADQLLAFTCCWPQLEQPAPLPQLTPEGGQPAELFVASIVAESLHAVSPARVGTMAVELAAPLPFPTSCCLAPAR